MAKKIVVWYREIDKYDEHIHELPIIEGETYHITQDEWGTVERTKIKNLRETYDKHGNFTGSVVVNPSVEQKELHDTHGNLIGFEELQSSYEVNYKEFNQLKRAANPFAEFLKIKQGWDVAKAAFQKQEQERKQRQAQERQKQLEREKEKERQLKLEQERLAELNRQAAEREKELQLQFKNKLDPLFESLDAKVTSVDVKPGGMLRIHLSNQMALNVVKENMEENISEFVDQFNQLQEENTGILQKHKETIKKWKDDQIEKIKTQDEEARLQWIQQNKATISEVPHTKFISKSDKVKSSKAKVDPKQLSNQNESKASLERVELNTNPKEFGKQESATLDPKALANQNESKASLERVELNTKPTLFGAKESAALDPKQLANNNNSSAKLDRIKLTKVEKEAIKKLPSNFTGRKKL